MAMSLTPNACRTSMPRPNALNNAQVTDTFHALVQSILAGEDSTINETPEAWRDRIENYAADLERSAYGPA